ncbi:MAG TPA: amino acid adenylation domain-containing protein [Flavobacteriales bacterium]|nr:amino acid adenylation domain-containing protein [Flavobacteriales bacterium]
MPLEPFDPISLFVRSAERWPQRIALEVADGHWSYAELNDRSNALADTLVAAGAEGQRVAFVARRDGPWTYAAILAILKAGASCVPLLPEGPVQRWNTMLERSGASFILGSLHPSPAEVELRAQRQELTWCDPVSNDKPAPLFVPREVPTNAEAYVMFTSGSTGGPKGVSVTRRNVAAYLGQFLGEYRFTPEDRFTQHFALPFDLSVHDLFVSWSSGACLCVPSDAGGLRAATWARKERITVWFSVPSLGAVMRRARTLVPGSLPDLRYAFFCGEALLWELITEWQRAASNARIINLYGPTEATIAITAYEVAGPAPVEGGTVPIGRPFGANRVMVTPLDGTTDVNEGELLLGGPQIAAGYINAPEATARSFVQVPGKPGTWYRTGDHVRMDAAGVLHFIGRVDHQLKVLGHRVEPGEVDETLAGVLGGGNAVTVPVVLNGVTRLITYVDVPADVDRLLGHLRNELPTHFVPERIVVLDELPRTPNGKWDRPRLIHMAQDGQ